MSNFEKSGPGDLSPEALEKIKKPVEGGNIEEERNKFRSEDEVFEHADKDAPVIPSDPRKREDWQNLQQNEQMEMWSKYQEQKKAREKWENDQKVVPFKDKEAA